MSLKKRILLAAFLVLIIFIILTSFALENAFHKSAETAQYERLKGLIYNLLASVEIDNSGELTVYDISEPLLQQTASGLYGLILNNDKSIVWRSKSYIGSNFEPALLTVQSVGEWQTLYLHNYFYVSLGVEWVISENKTYRFTAYITQNNKNYIKQRNAFRFHLWLWLGSMALLLLFFQWIVLYWGLLPLHKVQQELKQIEEGQQEAIKHHYPKEIQVLTKNINALLQQERKRQTRYRNALDNLAHSLKTPLAVLQNSLDQTQISYIEWEKSAQIQLNRIYSIIEHQLKTASAQGRVLLGKKVSLQKTAQRLVDALSKVYRDKAINYHIDIDSTVTIVMNQDDLMEIMGNLLDNASKWCKKNVSVKALNQNNKIILSIADDGPGIPEDKKEKVLQRGQRIDESIEGQGIGLAVVVDTIASYEGEIFIERDEILQGAKIIIYF